MLFRKTVSTIALLFAPWGWKSSNKLINPSHFQSPWAWFIAPAFYLLEKIMYLGSKNKGQKKKCQKILLKTGAQKVPCLGFNHRMIEMYSFKNGCVNIPHPLPQCPSSPIASVWRLINICTDTNTHTHKHTEFVSHIFKDCFEIQGTASLIKHTGGCVLLVH